MRHDTGWPVFALEHGLSAAEVDDLEDAVRSSLRPSLRVPNGEPPSQRVALPWLVYASEFGYRYAGDEYWASFAKATPGWHHRWRDSIRDAFQDFARRYHGAQPEGVWARNFTIIAWPITHGILPRDLQRQLAKVLYEARYSLEPAMFESAGTLGRFLRSEGDGTSARFRDFAENTRLLGQIAAALLLQQPDDERLISAATLARLVEDINRERAGREWLQEARSSAERLSVHGLSTRSMVSLTPYAGVTAVTPTPTQSRGPSVGPGDTLAGVAPRFLVRPSSNRWDVVLEIPDLLPLLRAAPHIRDVLTRSRGRITGAVAPIIGRGQLTQGGAQRFALASWPAAGHPLITFDETTPDLRLFLESAFAAPVGSQWLFRIGSDGQGYQQQTPMVQPGDTYLLLAAGHSGAPSDPGFTAVAVNCGGISAVQFEVPAVVDAAAEAQLERLGLQCAKRLTVWPAGLPAAAWDGDGHGEWIVGDEVILGVRVDHAIRGVSATLDQRAAQSYAAALDEGGGVFFLNLGPLAEGAHRVTIETERRSGARDHIRGHLDIRVRTSRDGATTGWSQQALALMVYPPIPTLEDVWESRAELQLSGPAGVPVQCSVALESRDGGVLAAKALGALRTPIESVRWRALVQEQLRKSKEIERLYDTAHAVRIVFDAGLVGRVQLLSEREFTPLRWAVQHGQGTSTVCLIDDSGSEDVAVCVRNVQTPDARAVIEYETALRGIPLRFPGALVSAVAPGRAAHAIVVPRPSHVRPSDLAVTPAVRALRPDVGVVADGLHLAGAWEDARLRGSVLLGPMYQARAVRALLAEVFASIGGGRWVFLERAYAQVAGQTPGYCAALRDAVTDDAAGREYLSVLAHDIDHVTATDPAGRVERFTQLVRMYVSEPLPVRGPSPRQPAPRLTVGTDQRVATPHAACATESDHARDLAEFALRAASSPSRLFPWCGDDVVSGVRQLLAHPIIGRAARYLVAEVDWAHRMLGGDTDAPYAGWTW